MTRPWRCSVRGWKPPRHGWCAVPRRIGSLGVHADRRLLVHALVNLLKNALEAAAAAGISPVITLSAAVEGTRVWLGVADNGPGIAEADPSASSRRDIRRRALAGAAGLAIVEESIDVQGGEIRVSSRTGVGTRFAVGLPLARDQ